MATNRFSRRDVVIGLATLPAAMGIARMASAATPQQSAISTDQGAGISRGSESIHQEVVFKASRKRVYEALTDQAQFEQVVRFSAAAKSGMVSSKVPTQIGRDVGAAFSLFGGYISGRHLVLEPDTRIVQAWRSGSWNADDYSIVKFDLAEEGPGTRLVLDHRGFPDGQATHLAEGWQVNYWQPLAHYLG